MLICTCHSSSSQFPLGLCQWQPAFRVIGTGHWFFSLGPISTPPPHCWHFGSRWQQPQLVVCPSTPVSSHSKKKDTQRKRREENRQHSALTDKQHLRNRKQIIHKNQRPSKSRKLQHTKKSKETYIWKQSMQIACKKRQRYQSDTIKQ